LSRDGFDEASYLYHTISLTSDYMVLRNENDPAHEDFFGIRAVLAPVTLKLPPYFQKRAVHGRFAVYEASPEGYFSLVDIGASYDAPRSTWFNLVTRWLNSWMLRGGELIALDTKVAGSPELAPWQALPKPSIKFLTPRGRL